MKKRIILLLIAIVVFLQGKRERIYLKVDFTWRSKLIFIINRRGIWSVIFKMRRPWILF